MFGKTKGCGFVIGQKEKMETLSKQKRFSEMGT
jgi:hypothetical protein